MKKGYEDIILVSGEIVEMNTKPISHTDAQTFVRMSDNLIIGIVDKEEELDDDHEAMIFIWRKDADNIYQYTGDMWFDSSGKNGKTIWTAMPHKEDNAGQLTRVESDITDW